MRVAVRAGSLKPAVCSFRPSERTHTNPSERRTLPFLPRSRATNPAERRRMRPSGLTASTPSEASFAGGRGERTRGTANVRFFVAGTAAMVLVTAPSGPDRPRPQPSRPCAHADCTEPAWLSLSETRGCPAPGGQQCSDTLPDETRGLLDPGKHTVGRVLSVSRFALTSTSRSWSTPTQLGNRLSSTW
jgi:hypothetical protein